VAQDDAKKAEEDKAKLAADKKKEIEKREAELV
jgi:hypothetical protein